MELSAGTTANWIAPVFNESVYQLDLARPHVLIDQALKPIVQPVDVEPASCPEYCETSLLLGLGRTDKREGNTTAVSL